MFETAVLGVHVSMNHIPSERLLEVAERDDLIFALDEFTHLKACAGCFREWSEYVRLREAPNSEPQPR